MKNFIVYKSSAGSGKTFTLVLEYLKLCLFDNNALKFKYKKILAITFTNKAASEMKNRVISALYQIIHEEKLSNIGELLLQHLNVSQPELKRRASIVLSQILHHYSDFSIGTIDSFTHKLVKTFAFDLKLPNNFNIEMDTNGFHNKVIALLLNKIGEDEYISKLLKEFANIKAENNEVWDPEKQLKEFTTLLLQEDSDHFTAKLNVYTATELEDFRKQFNDFNHYYINELKTVSLKALQLIEINHLKDSDFLHISSGPQNFFKKCFNSVVTLEDAKSSRIGDAIKNGKWWTKIKKPLYDLVGPQLSEIALQLVEFIEKNIKAYTLTSILAKQMYVLMLLKKIEEISDELKNENQIVFLSEFNQKISDIIANEPTPFIYERLGEKYQHYLIDEFQDTSSLQWHNLIPLIENSLSSGWQNLLVGDGKQSIYRWRNANVIQFANLPIIENTYNYATTSEQQQTFIRNYDERILNINFRSKENIINFNNTFFEFIHQKVLTQEFKKIYANHPQKTNTLNQSANNKGYVNIQIHDDNEISKEEFYLNNILTNIQSAVKRNYRYDDICILVSKNKHGVLIAEFLSKQGIPVVSSDSLLIKNNLEINTLVASLKYQLDTNDKISAAAVLQYFFCIKKISALEFHQCLQQINQNQNLKNILANFKIDFKYNQFNLNNVLDNSIEIINTLGLNKNSSPYIRFFLDEVNGFLNQSDASISKFIEWWEIRQEKASLIISKNSNAINVMTIHSSKGLEFPIVIVPFCDWALTRRKQKWVNVNSTHTALPVAVVNLSQKASLAGFEVEVDIEKQEQALDNLNMLYVAFTRAVDKLIILSATSKNPSGSVCEWLKDFTSSNNKPNALLCYELGENSPKQKQKNDPIPNDYELNPIEFETNSEVVQIKSSLFKNTSQEDASKKGLLLHELLSNIITNQDIETSLSSALQKGLITSEELPYLSEQLNSITNHPELKEYFNSDKHNIIEKEIILASGEILRPDRVMIENEVAIILDYKTGGQQLSKHQKQILKYAAALQSMGFKKIKKMLLYLDDFTIIDVN